MGIITTGIVMFVLGVVIIAIGNVTGLIQFTWE